jgi:glycosyltransferase involved in cell wall biosynthesis
VKVLHVNYSDLPGRRFSGYDLLTDLRPLGVESKQAVLTKLSRSPDVIELGAEPDAALRAVEQKHGMDDLLPPWGRLLASLPAFVQADVVHYHIIHPGVVSLLDLPRLASEKPSVWTFHDAWPLTGHCIQPGACSGWLNGCEGCPHLERPLVMTRDRAHQMWGFKKDLYSKLDVDVVVASRFMRDMVARSPLASRLQHVHLVPFGIRSEQFLPDTAKHAARAKLGIGDDEFVLMLRSTGDEHKGLGDLTDALALHPPLGRTTLLAVDQRGLLRSLRRDYRIVEVGWIDDAQLARAFSASDAFVMPSTAEGFGLMALESMAAGRPVICCAGTAVADLTRAPECGIAVPPANPRALRDA